MIKKLLACILLLLPMHSFAMYAPGEDNVAESGLFDVITGTAGSIFDSAKTTISNGYNSITGQTQPASFWGNFSLTKNEPGVLDSIGTTANNITSNVRTTISNGYNSMTGQTKPVSMWDKISPTKVALGSVTALAVLYGCKRFYDYYNEQENKQEKTKELPKKATAENSRHIKKDEKKN